MNLQALSIIYNIKHKTLSYAIDALSCQEETGTDEHLQAKLFKYLLESVVGDQAPDQFIGTQSETTLTQLAFLCIKFKKNTAV